MARLYDLMLLLDATAPEDRRQEILAEVQATIADGDGTIAEIHDWGSRRLSFEIDHRPEADYKLLQFEGGNDLLARLNSSLRIMDGVLRFRIVRQLPGGPPVPPRPEPVYAGGPADEPEGRVAPRAAADSAPEATESPEDALAE